MVIVIGCIEDFLYATHQYFQWQFTRGKTTKNILNVVMDWQLQSRLYQHFAAKKNGQCFADNI